MRQMALLVGSILGLACGSSTDGATASWDYASTAAPLPQRSHISFSGVTFPVDGLCPFEIMDTALVGEVDETRFFDTQGNIIRSHDLFKQQDLFTANGVTLTGTLYTASIDFYFSDGELTRSIGEGVEEKVRLPDGSLFILAGRIEFTGLAFVPDHGTSLNLDGFCAALSP